MMLFAIGIEHAFDVPVKRPHDADARHHRRAAVAFGDQDQRFDRRLPLLELLFGLRQLLDISGRVLKRDKLAAAGERDPACESCSALSCEHALIKVGVNCKLCRWRQLAVHLNKFARFDN
jgi:hypothetical protein